MTRRSRLAWFDMRFPRPLDENTCTAALRVLASDPRSPLIILEAEAVDSRVVYRLGTTGGSALGSTLSALIPGTVVTPITRKAPKLSRVRQIRLSTRHRPLRTKDIAATVRAICSALVCSGKAEVVLLQVALGPRRVPLAVPTNSPAALTSPWWYAAWYGENARIDGEKRTALRDKVSDHGFACAVRLGVSARTVVRANRLGLDLLAALRSLQSQGVVMRPGFVSRRAVTYAEEPVLRWPLRLNVREILAISGWPVGEGDIPGQPPVHPKLLPPTGPEQHQGRVVCEAAAPGHERLLRLTAREALHHVHVLGPTGVGKSVLLARLIAQDMAEGRSVVVIEPKGDLVSAVLGQVPEGRHGDVVVIDPADVQPVGLNPLHARGQHPAVVAEGLLAIFRSLYADSWGPRTQDILHAGLLTLARRDDSSLVMLPLLLTNAGFRRSVTRDLHDPVALGPFWAWYERLSDGERAAATAPVMNKLRAWLYNEGLRAVLGQREPRFDMSDVLTERRILLLPLRRSLIGAEAARLLGSLALAELWQAIQVRTAVPPEHRHPVMVYIDEAQEYLRLPTDLGEALATARGLGASFTLAHQFLSQFPSDLRSAVLSNARSRICFQLTHEDAVTFAKGHPELEPADFTSLAQYQTYVSLFTDGRAAPYVLGRTLAPTKPMTDPEELRRLSRSSYGQALDPVELGFGDLASPAEDERFGRRRRPA